MLESLHVLNLALIDESEITFGPGFNVLTGETGAGKSIVLGSVNLALGAKLNTDVIRQGKEFALVELTFRLNDNDALKIKNMGFEVEEDNTVLLQRKIMPGKSVCRMNGETVSVSQLKELSAILLDVYGQHEHQTLLKNSTYEKMLDDYAGDKVAICQAELKSLRQKYNDVISKLESENTDASFRTREAELLSFEINEIESAALKDNEDNELEERYRFLLNAGKIKQSVSIVHSATGYDNDVSIGTIIGNAVSKMKGIAQLDSEAENLSTELSDIENLLNDFNRGLSEYEDRLVFDEEEFNLIQDRLNLINNLKNKYGSSISDILSSLSSKYDKLDKLYNFEAYIEELNKQKTELGARIIDECAKISKLRSEAKVPLEDKLKEAMSGLNFLDVKLNILVNPNEDNIKDSGYDDIEFMISLNIGEELKPMQNVASGGELSRIMLALKSVFANKDDVPTLIFDEIDTGISGKTAYKVAEKMNEISKDHQIIAITHLPQIAAMADSHFLIEKGVIDGKTVTSVKSLDEEESVNELARMLGSDEINEAAVNNARSMKKISK